MTEDQQDIAWQCLPKETRAFIREQFEATSEYADFDEGYDQALMDIFGLNNITSDTEPPELLFVERKKVQGVFAMHERAENKVAVRAIQALFGNKCLPDKEPSVQVEPKFKVGDKVYCKNIKRILIVRRIITKSQKYELYDEHGHGCGFWEWNNPNLEPPH